MAIIAESGIFGSLVTHLTSEVTGSLFFTLLILLVFFFGICLSFKLPMELSILLLTPFVIVSLSLTSSMLPIFGVVVIYLSIIFAKNFFILR